MKPHHRALTVFTILVTACSDPPETAPEGVVVPEGECGHALYVISSDRQSSTVAIVDYGGAVLAPSILNSGSEASGLSVALSGDVTAPTARTKSGLILLLDRHPAAVLTSLDPVSAEVEQQVSVQTGFYSNPQDVLELSDGRIYVARYDANPVSTSDEFAKGSDIVVIESGAIVGRVDLSPAMMDAEEGLLPRPARLAFAGERVAAVLALSSDDYKSQGSSRVALIDPADDSVINHVSLEGVKGCTALAVAPSGKRFAIGCSGNFLGATEGSGIAIVEAEADSLVVESIISADEIDSGPIGFSVAFSSEDTVLVGTVGEFDPDLQPISPDRLLEISLDGNFSRDGDVREVLSVAYPFSLGEVRCEPACGVCFVADADRNVVHRAVLDEDGRVGDLEPISIDDGIGLPPRYLGAY